MSLNRRDLFRTAMLGCACCLPGGANAAESHAAAHWSYAGETGPEHWGDLRPDFKVCQLGLEQTPIDLGLGTKGEPTPPVLDYRPRALTVLNNGHTIQADVELGCYCTIGTTLYALQQFHFHHPSEHKVAGQSFDLECHFVHLANGNDLAVLAVFVKAGEHNAALQAVFDVMPKKSGAEAKFDGAFDPAALIPQDSGFYRYMGSLTTPPCAEGLTWTVFKEPIEASPAQIKQFTSLFTNNARPLQPRNRRFVVESN